MKKLLHIGSTAAFDGQSTTVSELSQFLDRSRRLPDLASTFKYHRGYLHAQGSSSLAQAAYWVANQLSIVDPTIEYVFPSDVVSLVKGIIHHYRARSSGVKAALKSAYNTVANHGDDSKASAFLHRWGKQGWNQEANQGMTWFMLGLYEPEAPVIGHAPLFSVLSPDPARDYRFSADVRYCIVIYMGKGKAMGRPLSWIDGDVQRGGGAGALAHGPALTERWFKVGQYVDDQNAQDWMSHDTKRHYLEITGRAGGKPDTYWHLSGWERFKEGAKMVGDVLGKITVKAGPTIARQVLGGGGSGISTRSPSGVTSRWAEQRLMNSGAGDSTAGPGSYARAMWHGHTVDFNRKSIVPPGYCFVKFNGHIDVAVVRADV